MSEPKELVETAPDPADRYAKALAERNKCVEAILRSPSRKRVVVAGPGTGKTYLFKQILQDKESSLTLTFVNALVEDLSLELYGLSEVRTLHSFARQLVAQLVNSNMRIFPKLPAVIREDAVIMLQSNIDFDKLFHERDDDNPSIQFYQGRKRFYGDFYGYTDVIFEAAKYLEGHSDKIPSYDQVLVDEFQDFNKLEVSLIELLSQKSPVLLAGDDDQALYLFKSADPAHIRSRHSKRAHGYEAFNLPYCSRSTRVIIGAVNDIVEAAVGKGFLKERIPKPYLYFDDPEKDKVSRKNRTILYSQWYARQIPWAIVNRIDAIAQDLKRPFSVLVISPTKTQCNQIAGCLRSKGFKRIQYTDNRDADNPNLLDGLKILMDTPKSNLGWRIIAKSRLDPKEFASVLVKTSEKKARDISELLSESFKAEIKEMVDALKKFGGDKPIDDKCLATLQKMSLDPYEILRAAVSDELDIEPPGFAAPALRNLSIKVTTIEGSKGLDADHVIIAHFDDAYFIRAQNRLPTDKEICNFLVALTRAREGVSLISSTNREPTFLKWVKKDRIEVTHSLN